MGGQPDQHDQRYLQEDVVDVLRIQQMAEEDEQHGAENRERNAENNAQRQRPAFVKRGQNQEDENYGVEENRGFAGGVRVLVGHVGSMRTPCRREVPGRLPLRGPASSRRSNSLWRAARSPKRPGTG